MEPRIETGVVAFGEDWPGVFIRGDDAYNYAVQLEAVLEAVRGSQDGMVLLSAHIVKGLKDLLRSSVVEPGMTVQKLEPAQKCIPPV